MTIYVIIRREVELMLSDAWLIAASALLDDKGRPRSEAILFLDALRQYRKPFAVLTNQSVFSRDALCARYNDAGFHLKPSSFYTSVMAAIDYAHSQKPDAKTAGYIGSHAMRDLLRSAGYAVDMNKADWVFAGTDRNAQYNDYCYALRLIMGGAQLIAADLAPADHIDDTVLIGTGAVVRMLEEASGKKAINAGFPSEIFVSRALKYLGTDAEDTVFIGTDPAGEIAAASKAGVRTAWITGLNEDADVFESEVRPTYLFESFTGLLR